MRVYISADIEGITGIVSWSQCSRPDGSAYDYSFARRMMTHDVNAAVRGARMAGATFIRIKDSHGNSKNLLIDELEPGVELVSGHGSGTDGMMEGIDDSFDAALLVGYHGMAGSLHGIMEHTITGGVHRIRVNDELCGEIGLSAGVAGTYGVPLVFISSDQAGCGEASGLVPNLVATQVKEGYGRYMGNLLHPSVTGPMIEKDVANALSRRSTITPTHFTEPTSIAVEFNRSEEADYCAKLVTVNRLDAYTVGGQYPSFLEAHRVIWNMMGLSVMGLDAQR